MIILVLLFDYTVCFICSPIPHAGSPLLHPSLQQPSLGMRRVSEAVDGGAAEPHRPVPAIQSTERGGWRKKTNWVGRSLFLARRKTKRRCNR